MHAEQDHRVVAAHFIQLLEVDDGVVVVRQLGFAAAERRREEHDPLAGQVRVALEERRDDLLAAVGVEERVDARQSCRDDRRLLDAERLGVHGDQVRRPGDRVRVRAVRVVQPR